MPEVKSHFMFKGHDIFLIPSKQNTFLLYAPTLKKLMRITSSLAILISNTELKGSMTDKSILSLVTLLDESIKSALKPFPISKGKSKFFHLALGLTKDCTLRCLYCHAEAGKREDMPEDILDSAIHYAFETSMERKLNGINVSFSVGGEPTTNWKLFVICIEMIRKLEPEYNIPVFIAMTTNGYYGERKRKFIAEHFDSILLSLDGGPEIQNLQRPTKSGGESYSIVRDSATFFIKHIKSFAIRSTVSNQNVKKMPDIVEFFYKEFGNQYHIIFEPLVPLGRANANLSLIREPSQEDFVKYYIQSKKKGKALGIEIRTSAANHKRLVTSFCGAMSIPSFTVTTNGFITTCERDSTGENYWYGKFSQKENGFLFNEDRVKENQRLVIMPNKCKHCYCKWHCAGDCPDVRLINYDRCYVNKSLIKYELESILED